ncbi:MAG: electron transfer flavoprotein subunit alpha/FixB family protein [Dehalococcoidia bacterium]
MADATGVLVIGEAQGGRVDPVTWELLAAGRPMADGLGEPLAVALLGGDARAGAQEAIAFGADRAYTVEHDLLQEYQVDLHLAALEQVCRQTVPRIVLLGKTLLGRDLAPRLAFRLGVGLAQDCLEVKLDPDAKRLVAHRPIFGGNFLMSVTCSGTPQMAAIRPKVYEPLGRSEGSQGEVAPLSVELDSSMVKVRVTGQTKEAAAGIKLEDAHVVVSGGRGLGGPEPFSNELEALAKLLGAAVGASRAAVDAGWVPSHYQIGLTGKTITPELYITVGISGASQHMAGCSGAKVIVAINKDAEANIFKEARYGVVGDWKRILPALTEAVRELVGS